MAKPIDQIDFNELAPTLKALEKAGGTTEHADWIRSGSNAELIIQFIYEQLPNPYEQSVEDQLTALRLANDEEKWGITEEDFARLTATAPAWPKGKHAYRSFRIRFGEGDEGVALTFERHVARIRSVFGENGFWSHHCFDLGPRPYMGRPRDGFRLLSGNHNHKPVIEWIVADLHTHRERADVAAVRGPKSLADELLVVAWLFPEMIRNIDHEELSGLFAAGYQAHVSRYDCLEWQEVVTVDLYRCRVNLDADYRSNHSSHYSVPRLRE